MAKQDEVNDDSIAQAFYLIFGIYFMFHLMKSLISGNFDFESIGLKLLSVVVFGVIIRFRKRIFDYF